MACYQETEIIIDETSAASFLEDARDTVHPEVSQRNYDTPTFWRAFMPTGDFRLGKGFKQQRKYYEQSYSNPHTKWQNVAELVKTGEACSICPELIDFGSSFQEYELEKFEYRGPDICLTEIISLHNFEEEMNRQFEQLSAVGVDKLENRYRDMHLMFSDRKHLMAPGFPYGEFNFPDPTVCSVGLPHESMLSSVAQYFDAQGGYNSNMGMEGAAPMYWAIATQESFDQILRNDPRSREDVRYSDSMNDQLLKTFHVGTKYKRFTFINDPQAPRFNFVNGQWVRVPYMVKQRATIGFKAIPNVAYEEADYESILFLANRQGLRALSVPQISSVGGNTNFGPIHTNFRVDLVNYGDNCNNPVRSQAYFLARIMEAIEPVKTEFVVAVMVKREKNPVVIICPSSCEPCETKPAPFAPAPETPCCKLVAEKCCAGADFVCYPTDAAGFDHGLFMSPVTNVTAVAGDIVTIDPLGTEFTVVSIADGEMVLGYMGDAVDCNDINKTWRFAAKDAEGIPRESTSLVVCCPEITDILDADGVSIALPNAPYTPDNAEDLAVDLTAYLGANGGGNAAVCFKNDVWKIDLEGVLATLPLGEVVTACPCDENAPYHFGLAGVSDISVDPPTACKGCGLYNCATC